jgi:hypothetical protein
MSFLTKPTSMMKGVSESFTLEKSSLSMVDKVFADEFFSDSSNWKSVTVEYKNSFGQKQVLAFNALLNSPTAFFSVSSSARGDFEITKVVISDHDNGTLTIDRSELDVSDLPDLDLLLE